ARVFGSTSPSGNLGCSQRRLEYSDLRWHGMAVSRRHFFFGSLLAGAVPRGGFGSTPSLKMMGYKSPNEKLNVASIGCGGKASSDIRGCAVSENLEELCDVDDK